MTNAGAEHTTPLTVRAITDGVITHVKYVTEDSCTGTQNAGKSTKRTVPQTEDAPGAVHRTEGTTDAVHPVGTEIATQVMGQGHTPARSKQANRMEARGQ